MRDIYIYVYVYVCGGVCVCAYVLPCTRKVQEILQPVGDVGRLTGLRPAALFVPGGEGGRLGGRLGGLLGGLLEDLGFASDEDLLSVVWEGERSSFGLSFVGLVGAERVGLGLRRRRDRRKKGR